MERTFLATTSLESFWDKNSNKFLFLGEWCKLYVRKNEYEKLNYSTLNYIWNNEKEIDKAILYCDEVYNVILNKLIILLNNYHKINKDYVYWNKLLRPWLLTYIQIMYDKYRHLKLIEKDNSIYTYVLKEKEYQYVSTYKAFHNNIIYNDEYNLQIYSQIIQYLNINTIYKEYATKKIDSVIETNSSIKENIFRRISCFFNKVFQKKSFLIVSPYFKSDTLRKIIQLSIKSKFLFKFDNFKYDIYVKEQIDLKNRKNLFNLNLQDEFQNIVFQALQYNIPIIYFEGYKKFCEEVQKLSISIPNIIYSANALHNNDIFKFYLAENYKKIKILYGQHGGNFGIDKINVPEEIEKNFSDIYCTFGWSEKHTIVLPHKKENKSNCSNNKIIFIMTALPRFFYRFLYIEDSSKMIKYINNSKRFLQVLQKKENLFIRQYMQDYEWDIKKRLIEVDENLKFDNQINYYKQIKNAKLVVFDHLHTGYLETLSMNIPTVVIIPKNIYSFRNTAQPYMKMLKDANILFDDPIKAAVFIDETYEDINKWWLNEKVQKVREEFSYRYARTSEDWVNEWISQFNKVLDNNARN